MTSNSLSQYCLNCETQANTIEELRAANERWVVAFKQAEERANGRSEALQAEVERLKDQLSVETEPSPYCPICGSCGDEGCCGSKRCMYPDTGTEALQADNAKMREAIVVLRLGLLGVIDSDDAGAIAWAKHHGEAIDWDQYPEATRAALQETER